MTEGGGGGWEAGTGLGARRGEIPAASAGMTDLARAGSDGVGCEGLAELARAGVAEVGAGEGALRKGRGVGVSGW